MPCFPSEKPVPAQFIPFLAFHYAIGNLHEALNLIAPKLGIPICNDCPDPAIACCHGCIGVGRLSLSYRVRMVIADNLRPAFAFGAMGIDQRLGINLEMAFRGGMDVLRGISLLDAVFATEQDTATLAWMRLARVGADLLHRFSCHFNVHRAWP